MKKNLAAAGVFFSSLGLLLLGMDRNAFSILDEGVIVYGAERLLGGDVQYRDFWSVYSPGQFWVVAGLFKIFGASLLVERAWDVFVRACIALLSYLIAARLASRPLAAVAWLISLGWLWVVGFHGYPLFPAALFTMLAALLFIGFALEPSKRRMLVLSGISAGVAAVFRHDVGFYAFGSIALSLAALRFAGAPVDLGRSLLLFLSGVLAAGLPVALYLLIKVPFADLWGQLILFPATIYPSMRSLPYPSVLDYLFGLLDLLLGGWSAFAGVRVAYMLPFFFPCIVFAVAVIVLARTRAERAAAGPDRGRWIALLLLAMLTLTLFLTSLVRPHQVHLIHVVVISLVVAAVLLKPAQPSMRKPALMLVAVALIGMAVYPVLTMVGGIANASATGTGTGDGGLPRAGRFRIASDQAMAIKYVRERVPKSEKIFVGNGRHDIAFVSDVMFYFLSERASATKFHELHPGLTTTIEVQKRIVADLVASKVNYVVLYTGADNVREPNKSAHSTEVRILDSFLSQTYGEEARFGSYIVGKKK